ncbi:pentapeptide repeat-containing protein [Aliiroseovarius marinus]|uniref:pentapeptide repeat-containing protein n=1 Tax=Aliiroseovarius marinus TaxID=2500159 RepID=UPI003D7CB0E7
MSSKNRSTPEVEDKKHDAKLLANKDSGWSRLVLGVAAFEAHPFTKLLVAVAAVIGILITLLELREVRRVNEQEAIARAWSTLSTPARGNSGKVGAIEFLASRNISLRGLDLSCEAMGGQMKPVDTVNLPDLMMCSHLVELRGLDLSFETHGHLVDLSEANFEGVVIADGNFSAAAMANASFKNGVIQNTVFDQAFLLGADFDNVRWRNVIDFRGAFLMHAVFDKELPIAADWECADVSNLSVPPEFLDNKEPNTTDWLSGAFHSSSDYNVELQRLGSELFEYDRQDDPDRSRPERCDALRPYYEDHGKFFTQVYPLLFPETSGPTD